jgi:hypothetical protein
VTKDGKAIPFDDLKDGQPAAVRTEKRGGKLVAHSIEVGAGAASAVPAAPEPGGRIARLRRLLQIADQILQQAENMRDNPPPPK